jgi:hypothetical protein
MRNYVTHVYDYIEQSTGRHVVKATTMYAGKSVSACAKCDPDDTFDLEFGTAVALKRLDHKITLKRAATLKHKAATCQEVVDTYKHEIKRLTKSKENAEIFAADLMVEADNIEHELATLLSNV